MSATLFAVARKASPPSSSALRKCCLSWRCLGQICLRGDLDDRLGADKHEHGRAAPRRAATHCSLTTNTPSSATAMFAYSVLAARQSLHAGVDARVALEALNSGARDGRNCGSISALATRDSDEAAASAVQPRCADTGLALTRADSCSATPCERCDAYAVVHDELANARTTRCSTSGT